VTIVATPPPYVSPTGTTILGTASSSFVVDLFGKDLEPTAQYREFTENAIQALQKVQNREGKAAGPLQACWKCVSRHGVDKLALVDTGVGMSPADLDKFINQLASSGQIRGTAANFGLGAKVAGLVYNHAGIEYMTWDGTTDFAIRRILGQFASGEYGWQEFADADGHMVDSEWIHCESAKLPKEIRDAGHGTLVVLHGQTAAHVTTRGPDPHRTEPNKWLTVLLESRYLEFPVGINVKSYEHAAKKSNVRSRTVEGLKKALDEAVDCGIGVPDEICGRGTVTLPATAQHSGATVHYWVLPSPAVEIGKRDELPKHVLGLQYEDEAYVQVARANFNSNMQSFGVLEGEGRVALMIQPYRVKAHGLRNGLVYNAGGPVSFDDFKADFRDNLPPEITDLIEFKLTEATARGKNAFESKFTNYTLLTVSQAQPVPAPPLSRLNSAGGNGGGSGNGSKAAKKRNRKASRRKPTPGGGPGTGPGGQAVVSNIPGAAPGAGTQSASAPDLPQVVWRQGDDAEYLNGLAGEYVEAVNTLYLNQDFRPFIDEVDMILTDRAQRPNATPASEAETAFVTKLVHDAIATSVSEAVVRAKSLFGTLGTTPAPNRAAFFTPEAIAMAGLSGVTLQLREINTMITHELNKV
jgi:hypothetical protein